MRRRAYALRRKLEQVYAGELAHAKIRIDVPKGSYVPMFYAPATSPGGGAPSNSASTPVAAAMV